MPRLKALLPALALSCLAAMPVLRATSSPDGFVGTWSGTYAGDATGRYSMAITQDKAKTLGGTITISPDGGEGYTATFKSVTAEGKSLKIAYDSPGGEMSEVRLEAALDGQTLEGAWKVLPAGGGDAVSRGTFTGTRQ